MKVDTSLLVQSRDAHQSPPKQPLQHPTHEAKLCVCVHKIGG